MNNKTQDKRELTLSTTRKYEGKVINVRLDDVKISNGNEGFREVVEHSGGVVIVPITAENKVVLIKQWRYPIDQELIELPAGKLEVGEEPFPAAKRELQEETGYVADKWEDLGCIFTAPGFCNEKLYMYKASDLTYTQTNFDDGEVIDKFEVSIKEATDMIKSGKINDAKTIAGIFMATGVNK